MNRHEELQDRYEDALFALLMDKIAMVEGEEVLEEIERLKSDPEAAIPEDVDRRCLQTIQRHFAKRKARTVGRLTLKAVKYAVMAAGIVPQISIGWLPDGYVLKNYESSIKSTWYIYQNAEDEFIYVDCSLAKGATVSVDTEDAEVKYVEVNGRQAMLIRKYDELQLIWSENEDGIIVDITASNLEDEVLLHMANEITF